MPVSDDLKLAYTTLAAKQAWIDLMFSYFDGFPPMKYVTDRLYDIFGHREARFSQNWAAVVVNAEAERIQLNGFTVGEDDALSETLNGLFEDTQLLEDADDVTIATLVAGEAFVFAWKDEGGEVEAYTHDPRLCHMFYDPERPHVKRMAAKWWVDANGKRRINLYYPERIEYYISSNKAQNTGNANSMSAFQPPATNPYKQIPIFHFRREKRLIKSVLANVIELIDAINKLTQDMMVAGEFGAFRQRYAITNADIGPLKNAPNEIWNLPAGDGDGQGTSVGEFSPTDLINYLNAMDKLANIIAIIERIPKHYILSQGGDPSGEALIAMEAPLNKKTQKTIDRISPTWRDVAAFMLELNSTPAANPKDITPLFDRPETVQPRTTAEIRQINVSAGIPLVTTLRNEGWTQEELDQLDADIAENEETKSRAETASFVRAAFTIPEVTSNGVTPAQPVAVPA